MGRVIAGFVIAPALLPVVVLASMALAGKDESAVGAGAVLALLFGAFTYAVALVVGVPLFFLFRWRRWTNLWHYMAAGAVLGLVPALYVAMTSRAGVDYPLVHSLAGALSAGLFWFIAIRPTKPRHP